MQSSNPFPTSSSAAAGSAGLSGANNGANSDSTPGSTAQHGSGVAGSTGAALHSTIDKVADPARHAVDRLSSAAHESVDRLTSTASDTANKFSEQTRRITEAPMRAVDASRSWVQDKPLEAVGAALALGFIIGRLTGR